MIQDSVFQSEKKGFKKVALLVTIPCAVLLIMMATASVMSVPFTPMFSRYDYVLLAVIYGIFFYGLFLSWQTHRKLLPFGLFAINILSVIAFVFGNQAEWLGYLFVSSIMATSISNQYFRAGSIVCREDCKV